MQSQLWAIFLKRTVLLARLLEHFNLFIYATAENGRKKYIIPVHFVNDIQTDQLLRLLCCPQLIVFSHNIWCT